MKKCSKMYLRSWILRAWGCSLNMGEKGSQERFQGFCVTFYILLIHYLRKMYPSPSKFQVLEGSLVVCLKKSSHPLMMVSTHTPFSSVQSLSRVRLLATPWITAQQASLPITNSRSLRKLLSIESVMPSSHLILCCPLLLLPPIPPSIRVSPNKSTLCMRWPKYWSFSFSISPSNEHPGLISFRMDWLDLLAVQGTPH